MSRRFLFKGVVVLFLLVLAAPVYAESNFSISPPPIAAPTFEEGAGSMKFRVGYISVKAPGLELSGGGFDFVPRQAVSDKVAMDGQVGIFGLSGDMDIQGTKGDMSMTVLRLGFNVEVQPLKTDTVNMIIFAGPAFDFSSGSVDFTMREPYLCGLNVCYMTRYVYMDMNTTQYGLGAGLQVGIKAGDFHIDPHFTASTMQGSTDTTSSMTGMDTSIDIDSYSTTSYGLDIEYVPWSLALSSLVQNTGNSGQSTGADVKIYQIGWRKDF